MGDRMRMLTCCLSLWCAAACASSLPPRYVLERDTGGFAYRRYQKTLDVEFVIEGNRGVGHTATYVRRGRDRTDAQPVAFATAFVTVYEHAASLAAEVRQRLDELHRYELQTVALGGGHVWSLRRGDERWAVWVSGRHVVKVGAPAGEPVPEDLVDDYMALYPSDLSEHGRARDDAPSAGPSRKEQQQVEEEELGIPQHLRESAPR
ncbi:MAG: hypothetical protein PVI30_25630 [Myxococcales bacterium]|jgi:hypothetical protein